MLCKAKDLETNSIEIHKINAPCLTRIDNNKKAKVILAAAKGNVMHPAAFMKSCRKTLHNRKLQVNGYFCCFFDCRGIFSGLKEFSVLGSDKALFCISLNA